MDSLVFAMSTDVRVTIISAVVTAFAGVAIFLIVEMVARRSSDAVTDAIFAPIEATQDVLALMLGRLLALAALVKNIRP